MPLYLKKLGESQPDKREETYFKAMLTTAISILLQKLLLLLFVCGYVGLTHREREQHKLRTKYLNENMCLVC